MGELGQFMLQKAKNMLRFLYRDSGVHLLLEKINQDLKLLFI